MCNWGGEGSQDVYIFKKYCTYPSFPPSHHTDKPSRRPWTQLVPTFWKFIKFVRNPCPSAISVCWRVERFGRCSAYLHRGWLLFCWWVLWPKREQFIGLRTYLLGEGTSFKLIMPRGSTNFLLPASFRVDSVLKMDALPNSNFGNLENLLCVVHRSKIKVKV